VLLDIGSLLALVISGAVEGFRDSIPTYQERLTLLAGQFGAWLEAAEDCAPTNGDCEGICGPGGRDGYDDSIVLLLGIDPSARLLSGALDST
jgi:hypothetical protein